MMNKKLRILLCNVSYNKNTCSPLFTALELNYGGAAWVEKPLSYFTFSGL